MKHDEVVWRTTQPLWHDDRSGRAGFARPAVLRLAGDDFMEQLLAALAAGDVGALVAGAETWRRPGAGLGTAHVRDDTTPIALFQPTHGRYYVVAAALVCRRYGHPDHAVRPDRETVGMLVRRLEPTGTRPVDAADPATYRELGWVPSADSGAWLPVPDGGALAEEERLALFPLTCDGDHGRRRTWAGLLPVARREVYEAPRAVPVADADSSADPLAVLADARLLPLETAVAGLATTLPVPGEPDPEAELVRESLFFTLVDLAAWLGEHLPEALTGTSVGSLAASFTDDLTWRQALLVARENEDVLFETGEPAPVAGLPLADLRDAVRALPVTGAVPTTQEGVFTEIHESLVESDAARATAPRTRGAVVQAEPPAAGGPGIYVTRMLYERPRCGPRERELLSAPSRPFRLAAFHDPDAPARPVRIAMPVDTSPGGLRKFPRNVSVVLSAELRRQVHQVSKETLRDGDVAEPPPIGFGMLCQLSIPIIAICALILLMVLVLVLNIVFFWVPLFKVCLPVPKEG